MKENLELRQIMSKTKVRMPTIASHSFGRLKKGPIILQTCIDTERKAQLITKARIEKIGIYTKTKVATPSLFP